MILSKAADYQRRTYYSRMKTGGGMDWSNKPEMYKSYIGADSVLLPRDLVLPKAEGETALQGGLRRNPVELNIAGLAGLLFMAYGFTSQVDYGNEVFSYRSAPSAGALYPVDIYLAARDVAGLEDGLYHYSIIDFSLTRLRRGRPPDGTPSPALILTAVFFRSAWKYGERAFRYCLLDAGHVVENLMATGPVIGLNPVYDADFDDRCLAAYLGVDPAREAPLAVVRLEGHERVGDRDVCPEIEETAVKAAPTAPHEELYELIVDVADMTAVPLLGSKRIVGNYGGAEIGLPGPDRTMGAESTWAQLLRNRRSRRNFRPRTVLQNQLARLLELLTGPGLRPIVDIGVVLNEIQDLSDGFYRWTYGASSINLHKGGFIGPALAQAALNQDWVGRANIILILSADLAELENQCGPRVLRTAYLDAGRIGQRAYLAAELMGWGCCGVGAFFDEEVHRLLDLGPGEDPLYLLPVGPIKKRTHGGRPTKR
jgi:SagB-type dehydrogenase family enzyme